MWGLSPGGAKEIVGPFFRPYGAGRTLLVFATHSLRCGLRSCAPDGAANLLLWCLIGMSSHRPPSFRPGTWAGTLPRASGRTTRTMPRFELRWVAPPWAEGRGRWGLQLM